MATLFWIIAILSLLLLGVTLSQTASGAPHESENIEKRIASILEQMTLEEKLDYIGGVDRFYVRSIPRLGLPSLKMADGPLGVRNYGPSTAMAAGIALAASWDKEMAERVGEAIGRDARAKGVHFLLGPGVNIYRAPMNGRNFEYFGEDPFLAGALAAGFIGGVQSQGVSATVKHFIANNSEFDRRKTDAVIEERTLREIYMPAFEAAVKEAHVGAVMTSYNRTNGVCMSQNGSLNNGVLKNDWGFDGLIMSDWTSTFDGVEAANGGLDLEMPSALAMNRDALLQAIEQGRVTVETVNDKVLRILRTAARFGWLDRPQLDPTIPRYNNESGRVARDAARGSMVLLKNEPKLLPLQKENLKSIAVIGPNAHPAVPVGGGSARVIPFGAISPLEGLTQTLKDSAEVFYHRGIPTLSEIASRTAFYTSGDGTHPGLQVQLYDNVELSGNPVRSCREPGVGAGECCSEIPPPYSSSRWTGYFDAAIEGYYDLWVQIPGEKIGYRLYLDDQLVLDAWDYAKTLLAAKRISIGRGMHPLTLELVRRGEGFSGGKLRMGITQMEHLVDQDAVSLAEQSDAVVVAVGFNPEIESESGDRTFALPPGQDALIRRMARANKNTVVVITSGGSVDMSSWIDLVPSILIMWYPGQEGGVVLSEILFGNTNPSGRLPVTFETKLEDNPSFETYYPRPGTDKVVYEEGVFTGYRGFETNRVQPLFPFGYGLSYTQFKYSNLEIAPVLEGDAAEESPEASFRVSFDLKNVGARPGAEVAQLYVGSTDALVPRPPKELKGFQKVFLEPGEIKRIELNLDRRAFCYYDPNSKGWRIDTGERDILIGSSSADVALKGTVVLSAMEKSDD
ncbi:MAG: glycoside hydrolase family 3 C-terminal domain-containing protein [Acidobacteriota bacterium]